MGEVVFDERGQFRFIFHNGDLFRHGTCLQYQG
jgi:hypothetical protein